MTETRKPTTAPAIPSQSEVKLATIANRLRREAYAQKAEYRQYDGKFDSWVPARVTRDVQHRGQQVLTKGEWCLIDPASIRQLTAEERPHRHLIGKTVLNAYLARNLGGCPTSLRAAWFEPIG